MMEVIFEVLTCVLAAYGLMTLIHEILISIKQHNKGYRNSQVKLVLIVKNQGETIEGVLRNVLPRDFIRKLMPEGKLLVLDMDSNDDTMDILRKLEKDYECLEVLRKSEKELIFRYFEETGDNNTILEHAKRRNT
ncbi:hypothetical protein [Acetivibrio mesophilus]|jgi:hypothetical protein|uniref:Uncharacterized protein n=1 Tax=Acetivibrio mesophilus TaxID=2487273 RepID=A0A4Q0I3N0_9FIRM|nr:hypothetical protein [Acetivibrio mesophilus]ODM27316.1 hypothetical protein A7W90_14435 [Clostridium sp. Bc-iso-3]RXE58846.1 hypothetical protein EFD62_10305 [Acetivibrio mesophilus]HHV29558.1 hypothetical protein [Clostridium sp.]